MKTSIRRLISTAAISLFAASAWAQELKVASELERLLNGEIKPKQT